MTSSVLGLGMCATGAPTAMALFGGSSLILVYGILISMRWA
jgi:hypothetical protein